MTSKTIKTLTIWTVCNNCKCYISTKEKSAHISQCPPSVITWNEPFILNEILFSFIDTKSKEKLEGFSASELNNFVFLSQTAIQLCNFKIGDPVLISTNSNNAPIVRKVWPTAEKSVTSVLLTSNCLNECLEKVENNRVRVEAIPESEIQIADHIRLISKNSSKSVELNSDITRRLQRSYLNQIVCSGNQLSILYYGKILIFTITNIDSNINDKVDELNNELNNLSFNKLNIKLFRIVETTKIICHTAEKPKKLLYNNSPKLGGLKDISLKIRQFINAFFIKKIENTIVKSILLYGTSGTGKTNLACFIAKTSAKLYNADIIMIQSCNIFSQYSGEAENRLTSLFKEASEKATCILIIDDIDILCPNRSSKPSEQEKRVTSCLTDLFDNLNESQSKIFVLATTNKPDAVESSLRRFGRLDAEIEVPVPNELARNEIFKNILDFNKDTMVSSSELNELASLTPGYVGSDLLLAYATARAQSNSQSQVTFEDLKLALKKVKPSAMREVQIESPNVHWSDIGGQDDLKLKLKQAVEWPLTHPESFQRMGVRPPRGVLMYGPPGCSKTMIAKALASETKLNFLSIKGPELFNKYVGESEKAVRDLFKRARQAAPSVIFFDEIDAIGGERGSSSTGGGGSVQERVLAQLLTELDGVTALGAVTVIAATNRPDRIDKALLRPGRLDRIIYVPLPDAKTRYAIINIKISKMPVVDLDLGYLVHTTEGYSGAEVEAVCNEAAMKALEDDILATEIRMQHFEHALKLITPRTPQSLIEIYENYSN